MIDVILHALPIAIVASTPLLLAVEGELVVQRAGIINLGIEGMMLTAAMTAVLAQQSMHSVFAGFIGGILGALLIALIFSVFAIRYRADQIVTGTAINLLALGLTGFVYQANGSLFAVSSMREVAQYAVVLIAWLVVPAILAIMLWMTRFGLRLRASGENPEAVQHVRAYRWSALAIEAVLVGIGGAYLSLALSSGFAENMTAGRGFIALSIVIFGRWKVRGAIIGTALFGVAAGLQYTLQAMSIGLPFHLLLAVPYVVTLLILCGFAGRVRAPESLGR
ncbi:MAG TPA: ABC transporter permease [Thermoanaerobaculia bacterium]|nr:ABC transporter permease [Thermoanaerobaculia bacterium]